MFVFWHEVLHTAVAVVRALLDWYAYSPRAHVYSLIVDDSVKNSSCQGVAQRLGAYVQNIEDPDKTTLRADKLGVKVRRHSTAQVLPNTEGNHKPMAGVRLGCRLYIPNHNLLCVALVAM